MGEVEHSEGERGSGGLLLGVVVFAVLFVVGFTTWVFARGAHPPYAEHPVPAELPLEPGDQVFLRVRSTTYTLDVLELLPGGELRTSGRGDEPETHPRSALLARKLTPATRLEPGDLLLVRRPEGWVRAEVLSDEGPLARTRLVAAGEAALDLDKSAELALLIRPGYTRREP